MNIHYNLHIKLKKHHIAVLNNVFPAFKAVFSRFFDLRLCSVFKNIIAGVDFRFYKTFFKIGVNNARGFWRGVA